MKAVLAAFNQEKALVGAFSVITNLRMELFEALVLMRLQTLHTAPPPSCHIQTSSQQHDPSTWYWQVLRISSVIPAVLPLFTLNRQSDQNTAPCFVTSGEYRMWHYRDGLVTRPLPPPPRDSGTRARGSDTVLTQ